MSRVICQANSWKSHAKQQRTPQNQKGDDGHYFDHGKPVFERSKVSNARRINVEDHEREQSDPNPRRSFWKP